MHELIGFRLGNKHLHFQTSNWHKQLTSSFELLNVWIVDILFEKKIEIRKKKPISLDVIQREKRLDRDNSVEFIIT